MSLILGFDLTPEHWERLQEVRRSKGLPEIKNGTRMPKDGPLPLEDISPNILCIGGIHGREGYEEVGHGSYRRTTTIELDEDKQ